MVEFERIVIFFKRRAAEHEFCVPLVVSCMFLFFSAVAHVIFKRL